LAEASEDTSTDTVNGLVKKKRVKEQELRKTLEQLEVVASQIEEAAGSADSAEDVNSIEKIAKLLQSISDKVEKNNNDESENKEAFRSQFRKTQSKTGLELNGIAEMIKSLEKVTKDLKGEDDDEEEFEYEDTEKDKGSLDSTVTRLLAVVDQDDNDVSKLGIDGATSRRVAKLLDDVKRGGRRGGQKSRGGKQLDLNEVFEEDAENFDLDNDKEEEEENRKGKEDSSVGSDGAKSYGKQEEEEDVVTCESRTAEDKVRICLPKAKTSRSPVRLPSAKLEEHSTCLDLGRTVCNESSAVLSREVCTYEYQQTDVLAPAQTVDLTYQPRVEKLGVTRCHVEKEKHGYKQVEVEKCILEYVDAPYILPEMAINVDEFMKLQLPEPEKRCTVFQYELPEVVCGEHLRHHCIQVSHLKPYQVTEYADAATLAYGGSCDSRTLSQDQEICTTQKKVKHQIPRRSHYQRY